MQFSVERPNCPIDWRFPASFLDRIFTGAVGSRAAHRALYGIDRAKRLRPAIWQVDTSNLRQDFVWTWGVLENAEGLYIDYFVRSADGDMVNGIVELRWQDATADSRPSSRGTI